jgi:hypothetical protein
MNTGREQGIRMVLEAAAPLVVAAELRRVAAQVAAMCPFPGTVHVPDGCDYQRAAEAIEARAAELRKAAGT